MSINTYPSLPAIRNWPENGSFRAPATCPGSGHPHKLLNSGAVRLAGPRGPTGNANIALPRSGLR
jgi:hypothetical protein